MHKGSKVRELGHGRSRQKLEVDVAKVVGHGDAPKLSVSIYKLTMWRGCMEYAIPTLVQHPTNG
jgi:hypothetical protein